MEPVHPKQCVPEQGRCCRRSAHLINNVGFVEYMQDMSKGDWILFCHRKK